MNPSNYPDQPRTAESKETRSRRSRLVLIGALALTALACGGAWGGGLLPSLGTTQSTSSVSIPAMRMEETPEAYKVTLAVPEADSSKLRASLDGQTLHIAAGSNSSGAACEQNIYLPAADSSKALTVNREKNDLVISIPKTKGVASTPSNRSINGSAGITMGAMPNLDQFGAIAGQMRQQFAQMQKQMDAMMSDPADSTGPADPFANFFGSGLASAMPSAGRVTVEDHGKDYVIRANNVDEKTKLNVAVDNGNVLKITTSNEDASGGQQSQSYQTSKSTQVMTLPSPVLSQKMTTKRDGNDLIITLPKA